MSDDRTIRYFAVFALKRAEWTEAIVALNATEGGARQVGQKVAAALPQKFVRCRMREMHLTASQVQAICHEWGRVDALAGVPLQPTSFPKFYDAAYRRGHRAGLAEARKAGDAVAGEVRRNGQEQ